MKHAGWLLAIVVFGSLIALYGYHNDVTALMSEASEIVFKKFEDEEFPLILSAGIMTAAAAVLISYFLFVFLPIWVKLIRLQRAVGIPKSETEFSNRFQTISNELSKSSLIGHAWKEFTETLVHPDDPEKDVFRNSVRPQVFLNTNCAFEHSTTLKLMPHIPNYFVGIGLLMTFVGLVAALKFATTTVGGDIDTAIQGLQHLLAAATFKFWTSIAGLFASIVISFVYRLSFLKMEAGFSQLCARLEVGLQFATPQRVFFEVRDAVKEQLVETKKINTDVAMSIADGVGRQLRETMPGVLADAIQPLVDKVDETNKKVGDGATQGLSSMVDTFAETFQGAAGKQMAAMAGTLERLGSTLDVMQSAMSSSGADFQRQMTDGADQLNSTMQDVANAIRDLIENLKEGVGSAGEEFGEMLQKSMTRLAEQTDELAQKMTAESGEASKLLAERIEQAAKTLSDSANENASASTSFAENLRESLGEGVQGVQGGLDRLATSMDKMDRQLVTQSESMSGIANSSREVASTMSDTANHLRNGIAPFQQVGETIRDASTSMDRAVTTAAQQIANVVETADDVSERLQDVSETLSGAWESYQERFENVDEDLKKTFEGLQRGLVDQQQLVQKFVNDLDRTFTEALSRLSGGIQELGDKIDDLNDRQ